MYNIFKKKKKKKMACSSFCVLVLQLLSHTRFATTTMHRTDIASFAKTKQEEKKIAASVMNNIQHTKNIKCHFR